MATSQWGLLILGVGGPFGLISQPPQTAGPWCVPVRPAWCPETRGSAPPSLPNPTGRPSGGKTEKKQNKKNKTGQVRSDDAKEAERSFRFGRPDLELDQAGRDGHPADRVWAGDHVHPPVQLLQPGQGDYTQTHTQISKFKSKRTYDKWQVEGSRKQLCLTLVTESFCFPRWTERGTEKETGC